MTSGSYLPLDLFILRPWEFIHLLREIILQFLPVGIAIFFNMVSNNSWQKRLITFNNFSRPQQALPFQCRAHWPLSPFFCHIGGSPLKVAKLGIKKSIAYGIEVTGASDAQLRRACAIVVSVAGRKGVTGFAAALACISAPAPYTSARNN